MYGILATVKVIRSLLIVPDVILSESRSGILEDVKTIRSLLIVPVNLDVSRLSIPVPKLIKFITSFMVLRVISKSVILDCGNWGICPSVNPVKLAPEPLNNVEETVPLTSSFDSGFFPIPKLLFDMSHIKFDVCTIGFVLLPIKSFPYAKLDTPVPPWLTVNVPSLTLLALMFVKVAPEPPNKLAVTVPLEVILVVSIPPRTYIIPIT